MARSKTVFYPLGTTLATLSLVFAAGCSSGKPANSPDDAENKAGTSEKAEPDGLGEDASEKSDKSDMADAEEKSDSKGEAKSDDSKKSSAKKSDEKDEDEAEGPPKDDSRTTAACEKVVKDNRKAFKKCYAGRTELKGELILDFELDAAGKIKKAYIDSDSTIKDEKVEKCMLDLAKTLTFPASTKGLSKDFHYTFGINNKSD